MRASTWPCEWCLGTSANAKITSHFWTSWRKCQNWASYAAAAAASNRHLNYSHSESNCNIWITNSRHVTTLLSTNGQGSRSFLLCLRMLSWPKPCKPPIKGIIQVSQTWAHGVQLSAFNKATQIPRWHAACIKVTTIKDTKIESKTNHLSRKHWHFCRYLACEASHIASYLAAAKYVVFQEPLKSLMRGTRGIEWESQLWSTQRRKSLW